MIEVVTAANWDDVRDRSTGYLVNVWPAQKTAKAHRLSGGKRGPCWAKMKICQYPKFYADSMQDAQDEASTRYHVTCTECQQC